MAGASFTLSLVDKLTGPGEQAISTLTDLVGGLDGASGGMGSFLASLNPITLAAGIASIAIAGLASALYQGVSAAISMTQEKDALRTTFDALGGGAGAGQKTLDMLEELSLKLPFTTDQLADMAKSMAPGIVQGGHLADALLAVSSATAIMGKEGGAAATKFLNQLSEGGKGADTFVKAITEGGKKSVSLLQQMGLQTKDLAAALGIPPEKMKGMKLSAEQLGDALQRALVAKGATALQRMGLTWDVIRAKVGEGFGDAFEDMGDAVTPFMSQIQALASEFYKGSTTSELWKGVVGAALRSVFEIGTMTVRAFHVALLQLEVMLLALAIAAAPVVKPLMQLAGATGGSKALAETIQTLVTTFVILAAIATTVVGAVVAVAVAPVLFFMSLIHTIEQVVDEVSTLASSAGEALSGLAGGAADVAANFISGLVGGIVSGAGMVVDAVKGLASSAVNAAKEALGIHSPSKVMMGLGSFTAEGFAGGIVAANDTVAEAASGMGVAAAGGAASASSSSSAAGASAGGGRSFVIGDVTINIQGSGGDAASLTEEAVASLFERIALEQGLMGSAA